MKEFIELARERYSVRKYKDAPVEQEKLDRIIEAGRIAPTARNLQPQRVFVLVSEEKRKTLAEVCPCTFNAPVIFVIAFDPSVVSGSRVCEGHNWGDTDSAIAAASMMFEAQDLGLGSCWVGMFNSEEVKNALGLPAGLEVRHLMPVGYPADDSEPSRMHSVRIPCEDMFKVL